MTTTRTVPRRHGDAFYRCVVFLGRTIYRICTRSVQIDNHKVELEGGAILASNHTSPYDIPCLMTAVSRPIDFLSIVEFERRPVVGWLFRRMNALFLDRETIDSPTLKQAAKRLRDGHLLCIFPEGEMRNRETKATATGNFTSGFGQLAVLGRAPVVPAVVLGSRNLSGRTAWLPWPKTEWGAIFGDPIHVPRDLPVRQAAEEVERRWLEAMGGLEERLGAEMERRLRAPLED